MGIEISTNGNVFAPIQLYLRTQCADTYIDCVDFYENLFLKRLFRIDKNKAEKNIQKNLTVFTAKKLVLLQRCKIIYRKEIKKFIK